MDVVEECSVITERMYDVVKIGIERSGGSTVIIDVLGERPWCSICDSTAYYL